MGLVLQAAWYGDHFCCYTSAPRAWTTWEFLQRNTAATKSATYRRLQFNHSHGLQGGLNHSAGDNYSKRCPAETAYSSIENFVTRHLGSRRATNIISMMISITLNNESLQRRDGSKLEAEIACIQSSPFTSKFSTHILGASSILDTYGRVLG